MNTYRKHGLKGRTYEEIYGEETAARLHKLRRTESLGMKRSQETRERYRIAAKNRVGIKNPFFGKKHSLETRYKISSRRREIFKSRQTVNKNVRDFFLVREWRKRVFERDNFTCKTCGIKNGLGKTIKFAAHHIYELHKLIGDLPFEEVIKMPLLYDINNGITLCHPCHMAIHRSRNSL